jgi:hypothetical protein
MQAPIFSWTSLTVPIGSPSLDSGDSSTGGGGATIHMLLGDARLQLRTASNESYGLMVLDSFTSDAIPLHLLTKEALFEYLSKLRPDGLLAFNNSNL